MHNNIVYIKHFSVSVGKKGGRGSNPGCSCEASLCPWARWRGCPCWPPGWRSTHPYRSSPACKKKLRKVHTEDKFQDNIFTHCQDMEIFFFNSATLHIFEPILSQILFTQNLRNFCNIKKITFYFYQITVFFRLFKLKNILKIF